MASGDLPTYADWQRVAGALGLRPRGAELVGPCPSCGGDDRFHVSDRRKNGPAALFGCRQCTDTAGILKAAFPDRRPANGTTRSNAPPTPTRNKRRKTAAAPSERNGKRRRPVYADSVLKEEARRWWRNAAPVADDTPAHAYLTARRVSAAANDAGRVRWLAKEPWLRLTHTPRLSMNEPVYPDAKPPAQAAGAILYPYRNQRGKLLAVAVEPLSAQGRKAERRDGNRAGFVVGRISDAWHQARPRDIDDTAPLAVCEGPLDAIAIAARGTEAWAAGGASVLPSKASELAATGREIQLWPDGDPAGRKAAAELQAQLLNAGATARMVHAQPGSDPHEQLTMAAP